MSNETSRSKPQIRPSVGRDITELSLTMRQCDIDEVWHSSKSAPLDSLIHSAVLSRELFTIVKGTCVVAIFGVAGVPGSWGSPWMLGTDELKNCRSLLRQCREFVARCSEDYIFLTNACWDKNTAHIEWIKWLGFTFNGSSTRNGETFLNFHKGAAPCVSQPQRC